MPTSPPARHVRQSTDTSIGTTNQDRRESGQADPERGLCRNAAGGYTGSVRKCVANPQSRSTYKTDFSVQTIGTTSIASAEVWQKFHRPSRCRHRVTPGTFIIVKQGHHYLSCFDWLIEGGIKLEYRALHLGRDVDYCHRIERAAG